MKKTVVFLFLGLLSVVKAEERFSDLVGSVQISDVKDVKPIIVPCITWGAEVGLFVANGLSVETTPDSIFGKMGLKFKLVREDDPVKQTQDYLSGKTPFWRGTFAMAGIASETLSQDNRTKPIAIVQMSWSGGDHVVSRDQITSLNKLKGTTGVLQKNGPHVGLVDDVLRTANLTWDDIHIIWTNDITGTSDSPAEQFKKNPKIDWACVITPDMISLTGGLQNIGSGAEGTVKGSRVLVSTSELSHSIADMVFVRSDFNSKNRQTVEGFVAGYLKGCELVIDWKKDYESKGSKDYDALLKMTQSFFGKKAIPTIEDAHGLISDCRFVGFPGNVVFFEDQNNPIGFQALNNSSINLAINRGYAKNKFPLTPPSFDYKKIASLGGLTKTSVARTDRFNAEALQKDIEEFSKGALDEKTIYSFTVNFQPNQTDFSLQNYENDITKVIDIFSKFGSAAVLFRAHADPSKTLIELIKAGEQKKIIQRTGGPGNWQYTLNGRPLDISQTSELIRLIESGAFDGIQEHNPRDVMQDAINLTRARAESLIKAVSIAAQNSGINIDKSQLRPMGIGIREPFIPKPTGMEEAKKNMRVEIRVIRTSSEVQNPSDFDF